MAYAKDTDVSTDRSRAEIERTLRRYGATAFAYAWEDNRALIEFKIADRRVRFIVAMPDRNAFKLTASKRLRVDTAVEAAWEQAQRQRWRALLLVIKAKLEAVEAGISTIEEEFMAHIALPDGRTVGQWLKPQLEDAYARGHMPPMLPPPEA